MVGLGVLLGFFGMFGFGWLLCMCHLKQAESHSDCSGTGQGSRNEVLNLI